MSSSDKIKDALVAAYPDTTAKEWKRRAKRKSGTTTVRDFEHPTHGTIPTFEDETGMVSLKEGGTIAHVATAEEKAEDASVATFVKAAAVATLKRVAADEAADLGPIEAGDKVQIRKGANVFIDASDHYGTRGATVAQRATSATVQRIMTKPKNWVTFLPQDEQDKLADVMGKADGQGRDGTLRYLLGWIEDENYDRSPGGFSGGRFSRRIVYSNNAGLAKALVAAQEVYRNLYGDNPQFVVWSGDKAAFIGDATKVAGADDLAQEAAAKPVKEKPITKRRLMVPESKWRFTKDIEIHVWISNPEADALYQKARDMHRSNNSQHRVGNTIVIGLGGGRGNTPAEEATMESLRKQAAALPQQIRVLAAMVPAGAVIMVTDKITASGQFNYGNDKQTNGLMVPCIVEKGTIKVKEGAAGQALRSWNRNFQLPYAQIEAAVEAESVPETIVYALRDNATGEYFGGWETEYQSGYNRGTGTPKMSKTFSGAKKYKTSAAVKASIRDFTGYNAGLNDEGEYAPEWASGGEKKIDLPPTWEMVAVDKTTNAIKETIEVQDWFKNLTRLRDLTQKQCSAVRGAYKKAEEDGLDNYEAILLFQCRESGSYGNGHTYDNASEFENAFHDEGKSALAAIKNAVGLMGGKKSRVKTQSAVAVACSLEDGITAKMAFNYSSADADIITKLLDIKTLEEIVGKKEATA